MPSLNHAAISRPNRRVPPGAAGPRQGVGLVALFRAIREQGARLAGRPRPGPIGLGARQREVAASANEDASAKACLISGAPIACLRAEKSLLQRRTHGEASAKRLPPPGGALRVPARDRVAWATF